LTHELREPCGTVIDARPLQPGELPVLKDEAQHRLDVRLVTYRSQGLQVKAYMIRPLGDERSWPGLAYARGGIRNVGMVRLPRMMELASRGYAVIAPVYRGNLGGEGKEDFGGEDRYDLVNAVRALRSFPFVEPKRIPVIGFSRGAIMAFRSALESEDIGPIAVWSGVSDLLLTYEERVDLRRMLRRVVGHPKKEPDAYIERSPIHFADRINRPVLIVHGTADPQVSVKHAEILAAALEAGGQTYAMRLYDGLGHRFPPDREQDATDSILAWFRQHESVRTEQQDGGIGG
jgi:dipeptidyl aminopeptidase/acylaminoacyl peptidase